MGKIVLLPEVLRNQIAAGEVVERPASVVKELVENSVDAGAGNVEIAIEGGGRKRISVRDDGEGMGPEDARAAFGRHATSKIRSAEDLAAVLSLGFRGEALAAISSVARVRLETTPAEGNEGTVVRVHGGEEVSLEPGPPAPGTLVVVEDLFYNTPARRKFLKSDTTEAWHCIEAVTQRALADLDRGYTMVSNGKTVINTPPALSHRERLAGIFGVELVAGLVPVEGAWAGIRVGGYLSRKDFRSSRRQQYFFVNGRPVRSFEAQQAIYGALGGILPAGRHPVFFLYLSLPPDEVDVNVHPAKREVRFADAARVRTALEKAVRPVAFGFAPADSPGADEGDRETPPAPAAPRPPLSTSWESWGAGASASAGAHEENLFSVQEPATDFTRPPSPDLFAVGSAFVALGERGGLTLVDYHAAHERILYERFLGRSSRVERLLVPRKVSLGRPEHALLLETAPLLRDFGIEVEDFGAETLVVREIPEELARADLGEVLRDIVDLIREKGGLEPADLKHEMAARLACREAVKAGDRMRYAQVTRLIADLEATAAPETCPHGRPTRIHFSEAELRRLFKRT